MKSMLIAAASVGVMIAGLVLYLRKGNPGTTKLLRGSDGNGNNKHISFLPQNAMG